MNRSLFEFLSELKERLKKGLPFNEIKGDHEKKFLELYYEIKGEGAELINRRSNTEYVFVLYYVFARLEQDSTIYKQNCLKELCVLLDRKLSTVTSIYYDAYKKFKNGELNDSVEGVIIKETQERPSDDYHTSSEVAKKINTSKHSVRCYAIVLQKAGYRFTKLNGQRFYSESDIKAIEEMKKHSGSKKVAEIIASDQKAGVINENKKVLFRIKPTGELKEISEKTDEKDEIIKRLRNELAAEREEKAILMQSVNEIKQRILTIISD